MPDPGVVVGGAVAAAAMVGAVVAFGKPKGDKDRGAPERKSKKKGRHSK